MKKIICAIASALLCTAIASAYNPPAFGDSICELSSPRQMATAASSAGGGIFYASSESIMINPALTALEQRIDLNVAYTALISTNSESKPYGNAFQAGILVPFKWAVVSGYMNGTMTPFKEMELGNSFNFKFGASKEITDKLAVGLGINTGVFWGYNTDWDLSANLGFVYNFEQLSFMKDFRVAGAILNLGKNFTNTTVTGINSSKATGAFPELLTVKAGAACLLYSNDLIKLGASADLTTPMFLNAILDAGLNFSVKDSLYINVSEKLNLREMLNGKYSFFPTIGLTFRFTFDVKNSEYLNKNGWSQSEMAASSAYKQLYGTVHAASFGVDVNLGLKDETPPEIHIWIGDEDDESGELLVIEGGNE
ncbi:MAG: autotransporter outer membrane beta-barrel domain-containing protein [Treponema sp.]|nr:autotransporter outer membrane beta-barrel domain-containing protein [Treponema sp.]